MSGLTLFRLSDVCPLLHLVAFIRADEFKYCGGAERSTIAAQRQTSWKQLLYGSLMNADPPSTQRYLHRWIPFSPSSQIAVEIGVSVIMCLISVNVKMFHRGVGETFSFPPKALT